MAATPAKCSAIEGGYSLRDNSRTTAAYLMKPYSHSAWNKRSTLWLSPVTGNLISSKGIQREQTEDDVNSTHDLFRGLGKDSCASI
jgi:hypothetical protein